MKTLLLNLPWRKNERWGVRAGSRWPFTSEAEADGYISYIPFPFFLAYATAIFKKESKETKLIDFVAEGIIGEQKLIEQVLSYNPELIVAETSTPSFKNDIEIIQNIHRHSHCQIALCGPHATVFPEQILKEYDCINYILVGEYEYTLLDLVNHLEGNLALESISGLVYRRENEIIINKPRPTIDNLDDLPWPERQDVPLYNYNDGFAGLPRPNVQMCTSRGCPFKCTFCLWPQTIYREHRYRKRNAVDVIDEMEWLIKNFNFKAVYFDDDIFNVDRNHVLTICEAIRKRKIRTPWAAMARADLMDKEMLESMSAAGLYAIKYGMESADMNILNFCNKNMSLVKTYSVIKFTKSLGIKVHLTFCLGLPGETRSSIQKTINFAQSIQPDSLQFSFATPFPGTAYYKYLKEKGGLLSEDWSDFDGNYKCIIKTEELTNEDLERIRIAVSSYFNLQ